MEIAVCFVCREHDIESSLVHCETNCAYRVHQTCLNGWYASATTDINCPCGSKLPESTVKLPRKSVSVSALSYGLLYVLAHLNWHMLPSGVHMLPQLVVVVSAFNLIVPGSLTTIITLLIVATISSWIVFKRVMTSKRVISYFKNKLDGYMGEESLYSPFEVMCVKIVEAVASSEENGGFDPRILITSCSPVLDEVRGLRQ